MLKKYLFSLLLFSAPLLSMNSNKINPKNLNTPALKREIETRQQWIAIFERKTPEILRKEIPDTCPDPKQELQRQLANHNTLISRWRAFIAEYEAEVATRADKDCDSAEGL